MRSRAVVDEGLKVACAKRRIRPIKSEPEKGEWKKNGEKEREGLDEENLFESWSDFEGVRVRKYA